MLNSGKAASLRATVNSRSPGDLVLRLFINDVTPQPSDAASRFTEATFSGYRPITLAGFAWKISEQEPVEATYDEQTFRSSLDQTTQFVYGYYVTQAGGEIIDAARFADGPYPVSNLNDQIKVAIKFSE